MKGYHTDYLESLINLTLLNHSEDAFEIKQANPTRNHPTRSPSLQSLAPSYMKQTQSRQSYIQQSQQSDFKKITHESASGGKPNHRKRSSSPFPKTLTTSERKEQSKQTSFSKLLSERKEYSKKMSFQKLFVPPSQPQIVTLKQPIASPQSQPSLPDHFKPQLYSYLTILKNKIKTMESTISEKQSECGHLRDNLEQSMQRELDLIEEIRQLNKIQDSNMLIKSMKRDFKVQLSAKDNLINELQPVIQNQNSQIKQLQADLNRMVDSSGHSLQVIEALKEELNHSSMFGKEEALKAFKQQQLDYFQEKNKLELELVSQINKADQQEETLNKKIQELGEKLNQALDLVQKIQAQAKEEHGLSLQKLQDEYLADRSQMSESITTLQNQCEEYQNLIDRQSQSLDKLEHQTKLMEKYKSECSDQIGQYQANVTALKNELLEAQQIHRLQLQQHQENSNQLQGVLKDDYEKRISILDTQRVQSDLTIAGLKSEIEKMSKAHEETRVVWYTRDKSQNEKIDNYQMESQRQQREFEEVVLQHQMEIKLKQSEVEQGATGQKQIIDSLQLEIQSKTTQHHLEMQNEVTRHTQEMQNIQTTHAFEIQSQQAQHAQTLQQLETQHNQMLKQQENDWEIRLRQEQEQQNQAHKGSIADIEATFLARDANLATVAESHKAQLEQLQLDHEMLTKNLKANHEEKLINKQLEMTAKETLIKQKDEKIDQLEAELIELLLNNESLCEKHGIGKEKQAEYLNQLEQLQKIIEQLKNEVSFAKEAGQEVFVAKQACEVEINSLLAQIRELESQFKDEITFFETNVSHHVVDQSQSEILEELKARNDELEQMLAKQKKEGKDIHSQTDFQQVQDAECQCEESHYDFDIFYKTQPLPRLLNQIMEDGSQDVASEGNMMLEDRPTSKSRVVTHVRVDSKNPLYKHVVSKFQNKLGTLQVQDYSQVSSHDTKGNTIFANWQEQRPTLEDYLKEEENRAHFLALSKLYGVTQEFVSHDDCLTEDARIESASAQIEDLHMFIQYLSEKQPAKVQVPQQESKPIQSLAERIAAKRLQQQEEQSEEESN